MYHQPAVYGQNSVFRPYEHPRFPPAVLQPLLYPVEEEDVDVGAGRHTKKGRRRFVLPDGEVVDNWREAQYKYNKYVEEQEAKEEAKPKRKAKRAKAKEEPVEEPVLIRAITFPEPEKIPRRAKKYKGIDMEILVQMMEKDEEDAVLALLLSG